MSNDHQNGGRGSSPALVDSITGGDRQGVGGLLCNDARGLCVAARGAFADQAESSSSGVYTSLVRLASRLSTAPSLSSTSTAAEASTTAATAPTTAAMSTAGQTPPEGGPSPGSLLSSSPPSASSSTSSPTPLITLELPDKAILLRDYAGYAVAVQIPKRTSLSPHPAAAEATTPGLASSD